MSTFSGMEGSMEALQAIHPSQLSLGHQERLGQLSIDSSYGMGGQQSTMFSFPKEQARASPQGLGGGVHSPVTGGGGSNNITSMTSISPPYISSLMGENCLFPGMGIIRLVTLILMIIVMTLLLILLLLLLLTQLLSLFMSLLLLSTP